MPRHLRSARPSPCQTPPQRRTIGRSLSVRGSPETSSAHDHRRARKLLSAQPSAEAGACADLQEPLQRTSVARPDTSSTQNHRQKPERARISRHRLSTRPSPGQTPPQRTHHRQKPERARSSRHLRRARPSPGQKPAHQHRQKPERARTSINLLSAQPSPDQKPAHKHQQKPARARTPTIASSLSARGSPATSSAHGHRQTRHILSVQP